MFGQDCTPVSCEPSALWPPPELEPNPDIAGIGVLVGFIGTAYLSFVLLLANYLIVYDPTENKTGFNLIDDLFLGYIRHLSKVIFPKLRLPISTIEKKFTAAIISMCDVQIVTGLGILAGGVASLDCSLSAYHWEMIVRLAWFSSVTHLSGISSLQAHLLRSNSWGKILRLALMLILLVCIVVAMMPIRFFNWRNTTYQALNAHFVNSFIHGKLGRNLTTLNEGIWSAASQGSPAWCFFSPTRAQDIWSYRQEQACEAIQAMHFPTDDVREFVPSCGQNMRSIYGPTPSRPNLPQTTSLQSNVFSIILLFFGFTSRAIKLFPLIPSFIRNKIRKPLKWGLMTTSAALRLQLSSSSANRGVRYLFLITLLRIVTASHLALRFYIELFSSKFFDTWGHFLIVLWGTLNITSTRRASPGRVSEIENQWTFGQVVPVALLIAPLLSLVLETISLVGPREHSHSKENVQPSNVPYTEPREPIWTQTAARLERIKMRLPIHHQSAEGREYTQAKSPHATSTKILLYNIIPGTAIIFIVAGLAFVYIGFSSSRVTPMQWLEYGFFGSVFVGQSGGSIVYHLMMLTVIDRQVVTPVSWAKSVAVNLYGGLIYCLSALTLIIFPGTVSSYSSHLIAIIWPVGFTAVFFSIDMSCWALASRKTRKEGRAPGVPVIA